MDGIFEQKIIITEDYFDKNGNLNPAIILKTFQFLADEHAIILKCAFSDLIKKGLLWVLTSVSYKLIGEIKVGDEIRAITQPRELKGIRYKRDFAFYNQEKTVLLGTSEWVVIDKESRRLTRTANVYPNDLVILPPLYLEEVKKLTKLTDYACPYDIVPTKLDIDRNNHVNNVKYVEFALKALNYVPKHDYFQIDFIKETLLGESLQIYTQIKENRVLVEGLKNSDRAFSILFA